MLRWEFGVNRVLLFADVKPDLKHERGARLCVFVAVTEARHVWVRSVSTEFPPSVLNYCGD